MNMILKVLNFVAALGAVNWGLLAIFNFNLVEYFCDSIGKQTWDKYLYIIIGIAGFFALVSVFNN